jgi:DNA-directed RNA polymerase subunit RPC12/RpoP
MLSDLNWKRSNVRGEAQCSRCSRQLLAGQSSIQIDRSRVCIKCWDEVRADPTKSAQEYKREFQIGSGSPARRSSTSGRSGGGTRKPVARTEPTLSPYDASLLVGNALDRAVEGTSMELLAAGDFDFHEAGFDYLVVGRSGVTIVGSRAYSSAVQIEALVSWSSTSIPANVLANGRNMRELIDLAVEQRTALQTIVGAGGFKFDVPVSAALCFESVEGIDRTPVRDSLGVQIDTVENIVKHVTRRGPVFESEIEQVVAFLRQVATPEPPSPDHPPASD